MATKDLIFSLYGKDVNASQSLRNLSTTAGSTSKNLKQAFGKLPEYVTLGAAAATTAAVVMAAEYQSATTELVTGAGESKKNLDMVSQGLLTMAGQVGIGPTALAKAMFTVESAGYHGAAGLDVMKAAAEGAKIGGADATTVADALTTTLKDYNIPASQAATTTSKLVATVAAGKTTMQDLAASLSVVEPTASKAGISLSQMLGAMATMTGEGISADESAQELRGSIASLTNPTSVQTKAMAAMGLNSTTVAQQLGKKGLTGTYEELYQSIMQHMGPSGLVLQKSFNQSQLAAQSANAELNAMPKSLQTMAKGYESGKYTMNDWRTALKATSGPQAALLTQWASSYNTSKGFSDALKSGSGAAVTFNAELSKMTGGQSGLATALALTGTNASTFTANVKNISKASADSKGNVQGWTEVQGDLNQQLEQLSAAAQADAIRFGTMLLPAITKVVTIGRVFLQWIVTSKPAMITLAATVGTFVAGMAALYAIQKTVNIVQEGSKSILAILRLLHIGNAAATKSESAAAEANSDASKTNAAAKDEQAAAIEGSTISTEENTAAAETSKLAWLQNAAVQTGTVVKSLVVQGAAWAASTAKTVANMAVMGAQKLAMLAGAAATAIATGATTAFGVAMDIATGPIGLIILGVAALVAVIILLVTHWKQVTTFLTTEWKLALAGAMDVGNAFLGWWNGMWASVGNYLTQKWDAFKDIVRTGFNDILTFAEDFTLPGILVKDIVYVYTHWQSILGDIRNLVHSVFSAIGGDAEAGMNVVIGSLNGLIGGVNDVIGAIDKIPGVKLGKVATIPKFATGTTSAPGGWSIVGENGPELMNVPAGAQIYPNGTVPASAGGAAPLAGGAGGGVTVVVQVTGAVVGTVSQLGTVITQALVTAARNGSINRTELAQALRVQST